MKRLTKRLALRMVSIRDLTTVTGATIGGTLTAGATRGATVGTGTGSLNGLCTPSNLCQPTVYVCWTQPGYTCGPTTIPPGG